MKSTDIDTLIELYDSETHLYNAAGTMLFRPRRVVFLIPEHAALIYNKYKDAYMRIWRSHGCLPEMTESVLTQTDDFMNLSEVIAQYIKSGDPHGRAVLDIKGGSPALYVAAGYICAREPLGVSVVKTDYSREIITEYIYDRASNTHKASARDFTPDESGRVSLTVDECIRIYGGTIRSSTISDLLSSGMTRKQIFDDAAAMWNAVSHSSKTTWNYVVPDRIHLHNEQKLMIYVNGNDIKSAAVSNVVKALSASGMIIPCGIEGARYLYRCASHCVLKCLRKAGELLELYMCALASSIPGVTDAICGVSIDYDGEDGRADNEIDVIFMRAGIPVFISCKNGRVDSDELYKFSTVCRQFGGNEHVSILAAPNFFCDSDGGTYAKRLTRIYERAELYEIKILSSPYGRTHKSIANEIDRISK